MLVPNNANQVLTGIQSVNLNRLLCAINGANLTTFHVHNRDASGDAHGQNDVH